MFAYDAFMSPNYLTRRNEFILSSQGIPGDGHFHCRAGGVTNKCSEQFGDRNPSETLTRAGRDLGRKGMSDRVLLVLLSLRSNTFILLIGHQLNKQTKMSTPLVVSNTGRKQISVLKTGSKGCVDLRTSKERKQIRSNHGAHGVISPRNAIFSPMTSIHGHASRPTRSQRCTTPNGRVNSNWRYATRYNLAS
jgi:hypothetical protein